MKKMFYFLIILCLTSAAPAEVSITVCLADGNTPLELADPNVPFVYRDIMVGTRLTIIIDSNAAEYWDGSLLITDTNQDYGVLSGRDFNDITLDWEGSRFEAAGEMALVIETFDSFGQGFNFSGHNSAVPGVWYIIDYTAIDIGICEVDFFDSNVNLHFPVCDLVFTHVTTRDFNNDTKVDFSDLAILASHWQETSCRDPNWCEGSDLNADGNVDINDLTLFVDYWLDKTE